MQESTPGLRSPAGAIPELLPHAPDQEWLHPGTEPPWRHYPVAAISGCVLAELNVCLQHPGGSISGVQTQFTFARELLCFHLGPCSSSIHFFSPSCLALWCVCLTSSVAFSSPHSAGSEAEQCTELTSLGQDHGSVGRKAYHHPASQPPCAGLTSRSGRPDCKSQAFFFFFLALCFLAYYCLQGVIPAVLFYDRHLLAMLLGDFQASSESLPCHGAAAARRVRGKPGS